MANSLEHWSRGCGTGIGLSDHQQAYSSGVLNGNWYENHYGDSLRETTRSAGPPPSVKESIMTSSYRNWGEQPTETQCAFPEVDRHLIFGHGRQQKLKDSYGASLYSLVYANPENDKWRVDRYTWSGKKTNDKNVPEREIYPNNNLGTTKAVALAEYRKDDRYTTTSQSVHRPVSMEATERKAKNWTFTRSFKGPHTQMGLRNDL